MLAGSHADWLNPVVLKAIVKMLETGGESSICGEMAREPLSAIVLGMLGIRNLSMDPTYIQEVYYLLKRMDFSLPGWEALKEEILNAGSAIEVRKKVFEFLNTIDKAETRAVLNMLIPTPFPPGYQLDSAA